MNLFNLFTFGTDQPNKMFLSQLPLDILHLIFKFCIVKYQDLPALERVCRALCASVNGKNEMYNLWFYFAKNKQGFVNPDKSQILGAYCKKFLFSFHKNSNIKIILLGDGQ